MYTIDPKDHLRAERDAEDRGLEIIGVVHSHTHTEAYPSPTDVAQAPDPGWHYVIVSLKREDARRCAATASSTARSPRSRRRRADGRSVVGHGRQADRLRSARSQPRRSEYPAAVGSRPVGARIAIAGQRDRARPDRQHADRRRVGVCRPTPTCGSWPSWRARTRSGR